MSKCGDLHYWLLTAGRHVDSFQNLLEEYACRLLEAGIPVDRVFIATRALHPQAAGFHLKWERIPNGREDDKYEEFEAVYPANIIIKMWRPSIGNQWEVCHHLLS